MKKLLITMILLSSFSIFAMEEGKEREEELNAPFTEIVVKYYLKNFWKNADDIDNPKIKQFGPVLFLPYGRLPEKTYTKHENMYERYAFVRDKKDYREGEYVSLVVCASRNVFGKSRHDSSKDSLDVGDDFFEQIVRKAHKSKKLRDVEQKLLDYRVTEEKFEEFESSEKLNFGFRFNLDSYTKIFHVVLQKKRAQGYIQRIVTELPKEEYLEIKRKYALKQ